MHNEVMKLRTVCHAMYIFKLECGPMPNVMAALPNIGGTLVFNAAEFG